MKKYAILYLGLSFSTLFAQNTLLERNFWQKKPSVDMVKNEISKGNDPTEANVANFDVVTQAILQDAPNETTLYLLSLPGNPTTKLTHDSRTYLHWAAYKGNTDLIKWLLKHGADVHLTDSKGNTPLVFGASAGLKDPHIYELFFQNGVNPMQKYKNDANILLYAIGNDDENLALTKYFLSKGISINSKDQLGHGAIEYAAKGQNPSLLKALIQMGLKPSNDMLLFAAKGSKKGREALPVFEYLINDLKIDPKYTDKEGYNALHHLLSGRTTNDEMTAYFLALKVNPEQPNLDGETPLMKAAQRNKKELILQMIELGITNINTVDKKGMSALSYAFIGATPEVAELLIKQGAETGIVDKKGNNLVYYTIESYNSRNKESIPQIIKKLDLLKNKGIDINTSQKNGNTLAHLVVSKQDVQLLKALQSYIRNINTENTEGLTPLHLAAMTSKDLKIIELLLKLGADKNIKTPLGETAYDLAKENEILGKNNDLNILK